MKSAKQIILNIVLTGLFLACIVWAAVAPGMQALIPTFGAIATGIGLLHLRTDYIQNY